MRNCEDQWIFDWDEMNESREELVSGLGGENNSSEKQRLQVIFGGWVLHLLSLKSYFFKRFRGWLLRLTPPPSWQYQYLRNMSNIIYQTLLRRLRRQSNQQMQKSCSVCLQWKSKLHFGCSFKVVRCQFLAETFKLVPPPPVWPKLCCTTQRNLIWGGCVPFNFTHALTHLSVKLG